MWWVQQVAVWLALGAALTAALNLLLMLRVPPPVPRSSRLHQTPQPALDHLIPHHHVYQHGEVYVLRNSEYHLWNKKNRTGLADACQSLYRHLARVRVQYRAPSSHLAKFTQALKLDLSKRGITTDPWDLARKWANPRSLVPGSARGLGDVLAALATAPITSTDVGYKGTQLKVSLILKGGQKAVFKPRWYSRDEVIEGEAYAGADRHNGEVAAFHLSRLLGMPTVPLSVGRRVSPKKHLLAVATRELAATFFKRRGGKVCFYGVCYYCHKNSSVCDSGGTLEGSVTLWVPQHLPLTHLPHPWARTYTTTKLAPWEERSGYCDEVMQYPPYNVASSPRLLDLMDAAVFDFLIQNGDRHHYTVVAGKPQSGIILLDNGKSFGDAEVDHLDILAPLLQCCRLRQSTYERLVLLAGGGLSRSMRELMRYDTLAPILTNSHLLALDRRVLHVLAALASCHERKGGWHRVLY